MVKNVSLRPSRVTIHVSGEETQGTTGREMEGMRGEGLIRNDGLESGLV